MIPKKLQMIYRLAGTKWNTKQLRAGWVITSGLVVDKEKENCVQNNLLQAGLNTMRYQLVAWGHKGMPILVIASLVNDRRSSFHLLFPFAKSRRLMIDLTPIIEIDGLTFDAMLPGPCAQGKAGGG